VCVTEFLLTGLQLLCPLALSAWRIVLTCIARSKLRYVRLILIAASLNVVLNLVCLPDS
jgi:hypothetical protein